MNYYPFHPGDYLRDTAHLSPMEDITYRRLLDMYYLSEQPIPMETDLVSRRLRLGSDLVSSVLKEFFVEAQEGWIHRRCDKEIAAYQARSERAKKNGKAGGRPKKTQQVISRFTLATDLQANQNQNQNQISTSPPSVPATPSPEVPKSAYSKPRPPRPPSTADPRHAEFVAIFADEYADATGQPYAMAGGKDGQQLQTLLKTLKDLTADEWRTGIRWSWQIASQDAFANACVRQTGSLAAFCSAWSRLVAYHSTYQTPRQ
jgi:uncharacterized protein YdaU (DUF1376 family)